MAQRRVEKLMEYRFIYDMRETEVESTLDQYATAGWIVVQFAQTISESRRYWALVGRDKNA
jgi:hypothetical protein